MTCTLNRFTIESFQKTNCQINDKVKREIVCHDHVIDEQTISHSSVQKWAEHTMNIDCLVDVDMGHVFK
jgi:hypothetical protein